MDADQNGSHELKVTNDGLIIGSSSAASANLHLQGNGIITQDLSIGNSQSHSTLNIDGTIGLGIQSVSSNTTLSGTSSMVLADTSSDNLSITLPYAGNVTGRIYLIKKISTLNAITLGGGGNNIDAHASYSMASGNASSLKLLSNGLQWYIIGSSGGGIAGITAGLSLSLLFQDDIESGLGNWTISGAAQYTGTPNNDGNSVELQGNENMEVAVSTSNYGNVIVEFAMGASSLDSAGETVEAEWYDGAQWFQMALIDYDEDEDGLQFYKYYVPYKGNNNANFKIRYKNNASGSGDYGYVDDVSITGETAITALIVDDFESGLGSWTNNGGALHTSSPNNDGNSVQIQGNEDIERAFSTAGYGNVVVEYALAGDSLDTTGETIDAEWYDGAQWFQMSQIDYTSDTGILQFFKAEIPFKGNNNANFKIRFKNNASGSGDYGYIDDVSVTGDSTVSAFMTDDFESGLGSWTVTGAAQYTGTPNNDGNSVEIQGNENIERAVSTSGYGSVVVHYAMGASSLDSSTETVESEWYDGAQWFRMAIIPHDQDENGLQFYKSVIPYKGCNNSNFKIRFKNNATGSGDYGYVDDVAIVGDTGITTIMTDDFESGLSSWTVTGAAQYTGSPNNDGNSVEMQGNENIERAISTSGYGNIVVEFAMGASSLDSAGETVEAEWYDGAQWFRMAIIDYFEDEDGLQFYRSDIPYKGSNNANFKIRFKNNASGTGDYGYVDDVSVTGEQLSQ